MVTHRGECFCGAVRIEVAGEPEGMGYCHCRSCRWWSAAPVNAFTLWKPDAVRITQGAEHVGMFQKTPMSSAAILQDMRSTFADQPSPAGAGRRLCGDGADIAVQTGPPHQLRRDSSAAARWTAEVQGCSGRIRGIGRADCRIVASAGGNRASGERSPPRKRAILATLPYRRI